MKVMHEWETTVPKAKASKVPKSTSISQLSPKWSGFSPRWPPSTELVITSKRYSTHKAPVEVMLDLVSHELGALRQHDMRLLGLLSMIVHVNIPRAMPGKFIKLSLSNHTSNQPTSGSHLHGPSQFSLCFPHVFSLFPSSHGRTQIKKCSSKWMVSIQVGQAALADVANVELEEPLAAPQSQGWFCCAAP